MDWIYNTVFYNIYPLGFCGAPKTNDGKLEYRLDKLYDWTEHLEKLGVNALVFNPVFDSSSHGYDTIDYKKIDVRLGDNTSFQKLCAHLHAHGIKVLLDGVFNHVGRDFFAFKDVQQNGQNSKYCAWFQNLNFGGSSPMGDPFWYEGWAGHYDLVKLNLQNEEVVQYLLDAVGFWIDTFDIDGLRLDAADVIDPNFFNRLRRFTENKKADFWMYGEMVGGDYNRIANNNALQSVTNYECYKGIYSSHNTHNYFEIAHSLQRQSANGGIYQNIFMYNFADNHDVNRIASTLTDPAHLKNVYSLLFTMPGAPSIYYGSEWAVKGQRSQYDDYDLRPCLDINHIENPDTELCRHISKLSQIRKQFHGLKYGGFENINIKNEQLVFKRQSGEQTVFIALNLAHNDSEIEFNTNASGYLTDVLNDNEKFQTNGYTKISIPACAARILVLNNGSCTFHFEDAPANAEKNIQTSFQELKPIPVIPGKYRHYKGKEYEVVGIAKHSETLEDMVIYKALYGEGEIWVRPYQMFNEILVQNGEEIRRFEPIE